MGSSSVGLHQAHPGQGRRLGPKVPRPRGTVDFDKRTHHRPGGCRTYIFANRWQRRRAGLRRCNFSCRVPCPRWEIRRPMGDKSPQQTAVRSDDPEARTKLTWAISFERTSILQQAGFINRDELHDANLDDIAEQPESDIGFFKIGRWVWDHNPELYAAENYAKCLQHLRDGSEFRSTNIPPGHVYRPWSMESENARRAAGVPPDLKSNGYWGV